MPFVAILDDQATNRQIFARLAASLDEAIDVATFAEPLVALEELARRLPDLVITDFKMPGIDGAEFIRRFRQVPGAVDIPVIVLTVYEERSFRISALEAGATDFLQSPVDHCEFRTRARNLLKLRAQQLELSNRAERLARDLVLSERSREEAVRDSRHRLARVIDTVPALIRCTDRDGRLLFANSDQARFLGCDPAGPLGQSLQDFRPDEAAQRDLALDRLVMETGRALPPYEEDLTNAEGTSRMFVTVKSPLVDPDGQVSSVLTTSVDITERKLAEARLHHMALHDTLTGLPNRAQLHERIRRDIARARRGDRPFALHVIDLDDFKAINDMHGHAAGDVYLKAMADRMKELLKRSDTLARIGGDEFAIIQAQAANAGEATAFATRIIAALSQPLLLDGSAVSGSASVGVTLHPADASEAEALLANADTAMYQAKAAGGRCVRLFAADMQERARAAIRLDGDLRRALDKGEFELFYQPQVDLVAGTIVGAEALIRWRGPDGQLRSPASFLPRAEETGMIVTLNEWVLSSACAAARLWSREGLEGMRVGVNLSPVQFVRQNVPLLVARILGETGLEPGLLDLELTESSVMEDSTEMTEHLQQLQELGVSISVDDFGTGYSSLRYLRRFPINRLKIDQSFLRNVLTDSNDAAIVRNVIALAHSLELDVIAEGVETLGQVGFLKAEGCREAQGYYFGRPQPLEDFLALARGAVPLASCG
jgi:diguanylate cyclase (GGDEF)-like protein/PAS domain S-box-containing protein